MGFAPQEAQIIIPVISGLVWAGISIAARLWLSELAKQKYNEKREIYFEEKASLVDLLWSGTGCCSEAVFPWVVGIIGLAAIAAEIKLDQPGWVYFTGPIVVGHALEILVKNRIANSKNAGNS